MKKEIQEYINSIPENRKKYFLKMKEVIEENIPKGFEEAFSYNMLGYVVPHAKYPSGYHCNPELPLPFINMANQKNSINLYHSGIYADKKLLEWFQEEWKKHSDKKLDMGKSCIRFKNLDQIPYELIGELVQKMSVDDWINLYERNLEKKDKSKKK